MPEQQTYKVKDPSGAIREIKGPTGATDEEILAQAKRLFPSPGKSGPIQGPPTLEDVKAEAIKNVKEHPWGSGVEHSVYKMGGKVTDWASRLGLPPEVAAGLGFTANVGMQSVPAFIGGELSKMTEPLF